jgi:arylsulfatase A-like enzyme
MRRACLIFQHACLWSAVTAGYGLVASAVEVARSGGATPTGVMAGALWSGGIMLLLGGLIGAVSAAPVAIVSAVTASSRAARIACSIQSVVIVLAGALLYVNHQVTLKTDEAMTPGAVSFLFSNPTQVLDMAWRFAGIHLVGLGVAAVVTFVALAMWLRRLNEHLLAPDPIGIDGGGWVGGLSAVLVRCRPTRPIGITMAVLAVATSLLLVAQVEGKPSKSLLSAARAFPPLRAIQLTRWLTEPASPVEAPTQRGGPVITDAAYLRSFQADPRRLRNVLLVVLESVPAKALHCYGYARDVSPHMDRLSAEGVRFEHCYGAASFSSYSLISMMTSLYMLRAEANDHFSDPSFPHVGIHDVLRLLGYQLAVFSSGNESWDNLEAFYPPERFDRYYSLNHGGADQTDCNRMDDKFAMGEFARWLGSRRTDRPFYAYINLQATHFNYEVPEPWASRFRPVPPLYSNGDGVIHIPADVVGPLKNQYDNALGYLDHWVGFIREQLERTGQLDRSIIIVVGDHGEGFMEHGLARHGMHLWNEMIRVPLIVFAPGLLEPRCVDQAVSQIDIFPTVVSAMGIRPHPAWQGVDVLAADYDARSRPVFSVLQLTRYQLAVVWGNLKYIADQNTRQEWLFDWGRDPQEMHDLVDEPGHAAALQLLRRTLGRWQRYQLDYYADAERRRTHYVGMPRFEPPRAGPLVAHGNPHRGWRGQGSQHDANR